MKPYENVQIRVSKHAHTQYCSRVELIDYLELNEQCQQQLDSHDFGYNRRNYIHLSGVWWVFHLKDLTMTLVTCYGRTTMDVPKALAWAARKKDRIDLMQRI